jgi:hypothetical protein
MYGNACYGVLALSAVIILIERLLVQTGSEAHPASYPMGPGALSPGVKRPGRESFHFRLVPRLRTRGHILPLPQYIFIAWCLIK